MKNNKSSQIRDMVVRCLSQMVQSQSGNIKSGWKNVFSIFSLAAGDSEETIVVLSFQTSVRIVQQLLDESADPRMLDSFQDCVKCLSEYACNQLQLDIAMEAIQLIRRCAKYISEHLGRFGGVGGDAAPEAAAATTLVSGEKEKSTSSGSGSVWIRGWFPVLFELSCIINRSNLDIRTRSLTILFDVVKQYGSSFESGSWRDLFSVLFRIFDPKVDRQSSLPSRRPGLDREWMDTTCNHALYAMTDVFNEFFAKLAPILLQVRKVFDCQILNAP